MSEQLSFEGWASIQNFPEWAPVNLVVAMWVAQRCSTTDSEAMSMVTDTLCRNTHMHWVWGRINAKYNNDESKVCEFADQLQCLIQSALHNKTGWDFLTKTEGKHKQDKIVALLQELATELKTYPIGYTLFDYIEVAEFTRMGEAVLFDLSMKGIMTEDSQVIESLHVGEFYHPIAMSAPTLDVFVQRVADNTKKMKIEPLLKSPNTKNSNLRYLMRAIAPFMSESFGSPHYTMLAKIGMAFFPEAELTDQHVRAMVNDV